MKYRRETKCVREPTRKGKNERGKGHIREEKGAVEIGKSICRRVGDKESMLEREAT